MLKKRKKRTRIFSKVGDKFANLEIIELTSRYWLKVLCVCGKEKAMRRSSWKSCKTCGDCGRGMNLPIKIGDKFGLWTVIDEAPRKHGSWGWKCKCDCGTIKNKKARDIYHGYSKSCGCNNAGKASSLYKGYQEISGTYWNHVTGGAKDRDFCLEITKEDAWEQFIKQEEKCALSGIHIYFAENSQKGRDQTALLDRIDSLRGYTKDNIQWVHKDVNRMKWDYPESEFIRFCRLISENTKDREI